MSYQSNTHEESSHYVARIVVERVDHKEVETRNGMGGSKMMELKRTVTELATLTVKTDGIEALKDKVGAHMALVDEIVAVDPVKPRGTRSSE